MKRSEINAIKVKGERLLKLMRFFLPPFAWWTIEDWKRKGPECADIARQQLGWDITDYGSGDFDRMGLCIFTMRNGTLADLRQEAGRTFAEKTLVAQENQVTPANFLYQKMKDIINRGGGDLVIQLCNSTADEKLATTPVDFTTDGVRRAVEAGGLVDPTPGESICVPQRLSRKFWEKDGGGTVLVGEVSGVNDDQVAGRGAALPARMTGIETTVSRSAMGSATLPADGAHSRVRGAGEGPLPGRHHARDHPPTPATGSMRRRRVCRSRARRPYYLHPPTTRARAGKGPTILELVTYRITGHSCTDPALHQADEEKAKAPANEPIGRLAKIIMAEGAADQAALDAIRAEARAEIEEAVRQAMADPEPRPEDAMEDILA